MMRVFLLLALAVCVSGYMSSRVSARSGTSLGMWGRKKKEVPPPPPPAPPAKKGFFSFGKQKVPEPEPVAPVSAPRKKTIFSAFKKEDDEEIYDPEGKEKDVAYKARRVMRFMTAPWVFNAWEDTEEQARKTVRIKSAPSEREKKYAALARGELSQDEIDAIRTNPY